MGFVILARLVRRLALPLPLDPRQLLLRVAAVVALVAAAAQDLALAFESQPVPLAAGGEEEDEH
jgi:hypothetical protein